MLLFSELFFNVQDDKIYFGGHKIPDSNTLNQSPDLVLSSSLCLQGRLVTDTGDATSERRDKSGPGASGARAKRPEIV